MHRTFRQLPHGAEHLGVAGMADEQHLSPHGVMALRLDMDLGDERAGGVEIEEIARRPLLEPISAPHGPRR